MSSSSGTSSDYFLDMVRPQMREMNPRQKMRFKQKIFNALMETFDDATDFPDSGAKHTPETTSSVATTLTLPTVAKSGASAKAAKPQGAVAAASPAATASTAKPNLDEKRMFRIMPMANGGKVTMTMLRQDSNSSTSRSKPAIATGAGAAARAKFVVPAKSRRIQDPLTTLLTTVPQAGNANKVSATAATDAAGSSQSAAAPVAVVSPMNGSLKLRLKRLRNGLQAMEPRQQRPRYSQSSYRSLSATVAAILNRSPTNRHIP